MVNSKYMLKKKKYTQCKIPKFLLISWSGNWIFTKLPNQEIRRNVKILRIDTAKYLFKSKYFETGNKWHCGLYYNLRSLNFNKISTMAFDVSKISTITVRAFRLLFLQLFLQKSQKQLFAYVL